MSERTMASAANLQHDSSELAAEPARAGANLETGQTRRAMLLVALPTLVMLFGTMVGIGAIVVFSFWKSLPYGMKPDFTWENYADFFTTTTYVETILFTLEVAAILIPVMILIAYPVAYFIAFQVKTERTKLFLLLLCIVPFWTSALIRMIAWLPLLGRNGLINTALMSLGIIDEPAEILLYSRPAMIFSMAMIWSVFMIGPIYFSMSKIQPMVIEAARDLGASRWRAFVRIILPLSKPGLFTGILFVFVVMMGEFAIQRFIGGGKSAMLANVLLQNQGALQWPLASVVAVVIVLVTLPVALLILRAANLRNQL
jgi:putative spermidine/putrescine transport system permease protein